jgi:hypothetical protein
MDRGLAVGAVVALVGAVVALVWLLKRALVDEAIKVHVERPEGAPLLAVEEVDA